MNNSQTTPKGLEMETYNRPPRKRATFLCDKAKWEHLQKLVKQKGYPQGSIGYYLSTCVDALIEQLEANNNKQLHLFTLSQMEEYRHDK